MVGPGMGYGQQSYMIRRPGAPPWEDPSGMIAEDLQWQMAQRRQQTMNERGRMLGQGYRMAGQQPAFQPQVPMTAPPPPGPLPAYESSMGMGGFEPKTGMGIPEFAGKVAGPVAMLYNAYQGIQSGKGYEEAAAAVKEMHPDDQRGATKDIKDAATQEAIQRMRAGAASGSTFGPIGTIVGAAGGAYGGFKGGASAVGKREMLTSMAKEAGKQQAAIAVAGSGQAASAVPGYAMYQGIKKLKDLF